MNRSVRSLRDLGQDHLPLLRNIQEKGTQEIEKKFGVPRNSLRVFVHYHPSYYHFHVHFTHIGNVHHSNIIFYFLSAHAETCDGIAGIGGAGELAGRAHLIEDIIENI